MLKNLQLLVCKQFRVANRFFFLACLTVAATLDEFDISRLSLTEERSASGLRPHSSPFYLLLTLSEQALPLALNTSNDEAFKQKP